MPHNIGPYLNGLPGDPLCREKPGLNRGIDVFDEGATMREIANRRNADSRCHVPNPCYLRLLPKPMAVAASVYGNGMPGGFVPDEKYCCGTKDLRTNGGVLGRPQKLRPSRKTSFEGRITF